jgi:hypothetical protein
MDMSQNMSTTRDGHAPKVAERHAIQIGRWLDVCKEFIFVLLFQLMVVVEREMCWVSG